MKRFLFLVFSVLALGGYAQIDFTTGLKSYHCMNNDYYNVTGNVAQNSNINTNYHTISYNAGFGNDLSGIAGNSGSFNGSQNVNIFGKLLNGDTDDFTIDFWFRSAAVTDQVFYWEGLSGNFRIYIRMEPADNRIRFNIGNQGGGGSVHEVSTTQTYNDGNWHHYAVTMTNGLTSVIYIDGVQVATHTQAYTLGSTTNVTRFGCRDDATQFLNGNMDNLKVWDHALAPAEIAIIYNSPKIVITSTTLSSCVESDFDLTFDVVGGPGNFQTGNTFIAQLSDINGTFEYPINVGSASGIGSGTITVTIPETISTGTNYKLRVVATNYPIISENKASLSVTNANSFPGYDISSGLILHYTMDGNADDFSGLGNDGVMVNSPTGINDRFGTTNSALAFNSPDRVDVGKPYPIQKYDNSTTPVSFSFWLKQDFTPGTFGYILSAWHPDALDGLWIGTTNAGRVRFRINGGAYVEAVHTNNQWQHFVCVYNGANLQIYRDGALISAAAVGGQVQIVTNVEIGQNTYGGGAGQLNAGLDDLRMYNRVLGADEVQTLYNNGLASNNGPLCDGDDAELYGPNYFGLTYDWQGPNSYTSTIQDPAFTPFNSIVNSGEYALTLTLAGCTGSPNLTELEPTVAPAATVTGDTVCSGIAANISATGAASTDHYVWYDDVLGTTILDDSTETLTVFPVSTDTFYVNIKPGALCQSAITPVIVQVNQLPAVIANATDESLCIGESVTLTGSGAQTYAWDNSVTDGVAFSPVGTSIYTVTGTDVNGCENSDQIEIVVNALPAVIANSTATTVCSGDQITLTGSGALSYAWDSGVTDGIPFAITSTTTFNIVGTDVNGCENSDAISVTVNALPVTSDITGDDLVRCDTDSEIYSVTNTAGSIYNWAVPAGAIIVSGQGTNSITIDFNGNFGVVSVTETNTTNCEGTTVSFNVSCNLSIEDSETMVLLIYPNPATEIIYLKGFEPSENQVLTIRDAQGKTVFTTTDIDSDGIAVSDLQRGIYSGTISGTDQVYTFRFSKM